MEAASSYTHAWVSSSQYDVIMHKGLYSGLLDDIAIWTVQLVKGYKFYCLTRICRLHKDQTTS